MADSDNILDYYDLHGTAARGCADRWLRAVQKSIEKDAAGLDPMQRQIYAERVNGWVRGRYDNLRQHEMREVRAGETQALTERMQAGAKATAMDILMSTRSEARDFTRREQDAERVFLNSADGYTPEQIACLESEESRKTLPQPLVAAWNVRKETLDGIAVERGRSNLRCIAQLAAETDGREKEWDEAVEKGLFSRTEAEARRMDNRRQTYAHTLESLLADGNDGTADAILSALEDERGGLAKVVGFEPEKMARFRAKIEDLRDGRRREAEAVHRASAAQARAAKTAELDRIVNGGAEAHAFGDFNGVDAAAANLKRLAGRLPEGSPERAKCATEFARFDEAADKIATAEVTRALVDAYEKGAYDPGGSDAPVAEEWGYAEGSRHARAFGKASAAFRENLRKHFDREFKRNRPTELAKLRWDMFDAAAHANPQKFRDELARAVVDGKITVNDYATLSREAENGWFKGFDGHGGELPPQMAVAKDLIATVEKVFGAGSMQGVFELDDAGDPKFDSRGGLKIDAEGEPMEYHYHSLEAKNDAPWMTRWLSSGRQTFTREEMVGVLNQFLALAQADGLEIDHDPATGARLPDGRTHRVNARMDFAAVLERLENEKTALAKAKVLQITSRHFNAVRQRAREVEYNRLGLMSGSRPMTADGGGE